MLAYSTWKELLLTSPHLFLRTFIYSPPPLSTIASLLRASHLLRVRDFKAYAQRTFEEVWSDDLESICNVDVRRSGVSATEAVLLGRLCGLPGVVKRGMYELLKSETFEQGDSDSEGGESEEDEEDESEESEDEESDDLSVIVIDSDIEMISTSRTRKSGRPGAKSKNSNQRKSKPKKKKKQKWTLPQKDFTLLTKARSKLTARWNRETIQFPESLLPCPDAIANAPSGVDPGEKASAQDDEEEEEYTCAASDAATAREAHRRLVIQSGVQERYMYEVIGGLEALEDLRWGWSPDEEEGDAGSASTSSRNASREKTGEDGEDGGDADECGGKGRGKDEKRKDEEKDDDDGEEVYYGEFCDGCVKKMKRMWRGARERVWKDCDGLLSIKR